MCVSGWAWRTSDIQCSNDLARSQDVPMPLASTMLSILDMATACGYGDEDRIALLKFWERYVAGRTMIAPVKTKPGPENVAAQSPTGS